MLFNYNANDRLGRSLFSYNFIFDRIFDNAIHEDTLRRISLIRFIHSSKYHRYYTHLVFYDFMCVCLFRFHVKHINCILCSRRHVIKFLQSLRESAGRGIQCKQARVLEWTQWITLQKKERYVTNASSQGRRLSS